MEKRINANLVMNIKILDTRNDIDLINDVMSRINSSVDGLGIIAGYIKYSTFDIEEEERNRKVKINKNKRTYRIGLN